MITGASPQTSERNAQTEVHPRVGSEGAQGHLPRGAQGAEHRLYRFGITMLSRGPIWKPWLWSKPGFTFGAAAGEASAKFGELSGIRKVASIALPLLLCTIQATFMYFTAAKTNLPGHTFVSMNFCCGDACLWITVAWHANLVAHKHMNKGKKADNITEVKRQEDSIATMAIRSCVVLENEVKELKAKRKKLLALLNAHPDLNNLWKQLLRENPDAIIRPKIVHLENYNPDDPIVQMTALGLEKDRLEAELRSAGMFVERHLDLCELFEKCIYEPARKQPLLCTEE